MDVNRDEFLRQVGETVSREIRTAGLLGPPLPDPTIRGPRVDIEAERLVCCALMRRAATPRDLAPLVGGDLWLALHRAIWEAVEGLEGARVEVNADRVFARLARRNVASSGLAAELLVIADRAYLHPRELEAAVAALLLASRVRQLSRALLEVDTALRAGEIRLEDAHRRLAALAKSGAEEWRRTRAVARHK